MNEELKRLIELQRLDTLILSTILRADAIPAAIASHEGPLKEAEAACEGIGKDHGALEKKKKDTDFQIRELQEKIGRMKQRGAEIKTNKEYQAHQKETEKAEADLKSAEDEILTLMSSLDTASISLQKETSRVAEEKSRLEGVRAELDKEVLRCGEELKRLKADRKLLVEKVPPPLYSEYMVVMKARRGVAVVEAKNEVCQGCNMRIPPQLFVAIRVNDSIVSC
ncbi:MAG: C4-type zinc ribbon domain-containing protein, partial [Thermodesulfovibrionales bacterium]